MRYLLHIPGVQTCMHSCNQSQSIPNELQYSKLYYPKPSFTIGLHFAVV